jgi:membrane protease YdiL (CAAX protease family)
VTEDAPGRLDRWLGPAPDLPGPAGLDAGRRAGVVLWSAAVLLVLLIFRGGFRHVGDLVPAWSALPPRSLGARGYWAAWGLLAYFAVPAVIVRLVFREPLARYGFRIALTRRTAVAYLALIAVLAGTTLWASTRPDFLAKYPLVDTPEGKLAPVLVWQAIRAARMVALEFFFRGYLLFGLEAKLGVHAVAAAALPYGVLHYGKPFPEALGAVAAAAVLGILALRTRSIFGGVVVHVTAATLMDFLALAHKGLL